MSPAAIPTWVFPHPVPSPPFFLLLPSIQHSTVQVPQYYTWLISNPAGWETGCCFHLSLQTNILDTTILNSFCAFSAELSCNSPCTLECSVYCSSWSNGTSWKTYGRGDPQWSSMFVSKFCWVGFGDWAGLTCAFRSIHVASLLRLYPHIAWLQFILKAECFSFWLFGYTPKWELLDDQS